MGRAGWEVDEAARDLEVVAWVARFRFVTAELLARRLVVSVQRANARVRRLEHAGLVVSGTSPDERLVEIIELHDHPFFVASQFHPEFKSRPERPAPLFREFVRHALGRAEEEHPEGDVRVSMSAPAVPQR